MDELTDVLPPELAVDEYPLPTMALAAIDGEMEPGADLADVIERWRITDDGAAEWAARHYARAVEARARVEEQAAAWASRIEEWKREQVAPLDRRAAFFLTHLDDYARRVREASAGEVKSIKLPTATVQTRESKPRPVVVKVEEFVEWAKVAAPDLLRTKVEPRAGEVGKLTVGAQLVCTDVLVAPACGHSVIMRFASGEDVKAPDAGSVWTCETGTCRDGITGAGSPTTVERVATEEVTHPVALLDGEVVPGVEVEPGGVSVSVKLA